MSNCARETWYWIQEDDKALNEKQNDDFIFLNMLSFKISVENIVEDVQMECEDRDLELRVRSR